MRSQHETMIERPRGLMLMRPARSGEGREHTSDERTGAATPESPSAVARTQRLREATRARRQLMVASALAAAQAGAPIRRPSPDDASSPPPLEDLMETDDALFQRPITTWLAQPEPRTTDAHPSRQQMARRARRLMAFTSTQSTRAARSAYDQFMAKTVCILYCKYCSSSLTNRGMRAILLGDTNVELYSTDLPPATAVDLVGEDYTTKSCMCKIRDVACLCCGNLMGYHVTRPCESCLESCHNGHFWMFHSDHVTSEDRMDVEQDGEALLWAAIPSAVQDMDNLQSAVPHLRFAECIR